MQVKVGVAYDYLGVEHEDKRLDINTLKIEVAENPFFFNFFFNLKNILGLSCLPNSHRLLLFFFSARALIQQNSQPSSSQKRLR